MTEAVFSVIVTQLLSIAFLMGPAMGALFLGKRFGLSNWGQIGLAVGWIIVALIILQMTVWSGG